MRQDDQGYMQVWTSNPDLGAEHQITSGNANSGWAVSYPDASRIAFDSDRSDLDPMDEAFVNDVFSMRADGTDVRQITDSQGFSGDPAYSPDGRLIAFDSDRSNAGLSVYVVRPDGSGVRRITHPPAGSNDSEPRFSPDGTSISFTRYQGGHVNKHGRMTGDTSAVFVVGVDGAALRRVTGWGLKAGQTNWAPDGSRIVFETSCCRLGTGNVYAVKPRGGAVTTLIDGGGITGIGNETAFALDGYYDPGGPLRHPTARRSRVPRGRRRIQVGLAVADADGNDVQWVSPGVHDEHQPDWGIAPLE